MTSTASSSRSSRSPTVAPKSIPKASCSRANQAPPIPRTARPPETWSSVAASFAVWPGLRKVFAPTISPTRTREVRAATAPIASQPSRIGCSHGPKIAWRWSQVQTESQPASSAATAAPRNPGQSVAWLQSWAPNRTSAHAAYASAIERPEARKALDRLAVEGRRESAIRWVKPSSR